MESFVNIDGKCDCDYCKSEARKKIGGEIAKTAGAVIGGIVACQLAILAAPFALAWIGFGAGGVRAVSWAARIQSWIGSVKKASVFASLTSMAMKGTLSPGVANGVRAVVQLVVLSDQATTRKFFETSGDGNLVVPENEQEWQNLIDKAVEAGLVCNICFKRIDPNLRNLCTSVCVHG